MYYFTTLREVKKLRTIFTKKNYVADQKEAAYGIVWSAEMGRMPGGQSRLPWFLKLDKNLEYAHDDTPVIMWLAKETGKYRKIQVVGLSDHDGRELYSVNICLTEKSITVKVGTKKLLRERRSNFRFTDITLRNISRVAWNMEESRFENGIPVSGWPCGSIIYSSGVHEPEGILLGV